jgi:adenylate cyclase
MPPVRRLAAILSADVAGYSRLMGADEEGTHERLKAHLGELINPKIAEHRGRVVKNTGDGFLAEFPSVVDAVRCAVEMQRGMAERNVGTPPERRIEFRVGINLGDVIAEEHDIFGDGVNVAARLEALAEPGGICVSRVVRDQVRDRLDLAFEDMGEQSVKNIVRPVRIYALRPEGLSSLPVATALSATSSSPLFNAPRLSIVVLPFINLSDDPEQQYFADAITEDVTTDLSRLDNMLVISRNTAFTYRNKPIDTKQIGRELGVRYVLEGSVRRSTNQVRVNVQLIDAATDTHLWAERIDSGLGDLFDAQNEITNRLANALGVELVAAEAARPTDNHDAFDYILRGRATGLRARTRDSLAEQISLFERALAVDPHSVEAQTLLAAVLVNRVLAWMSNSAASDIARAESLINQSLATSPRNAFAHYVKGAVLRAQGRWQEAIPEQEMALASNRNFVGALYELAYCKLRAGSIDEVVPLVEQAIRLSPRDPGVGFRYFAIGQVYLLQSRTDQAIAWLEKARSAIPAVPIFRSFLASAYALRGDTERAAAELDEARRLSPEDRFLSIARGKAGIAFPGWGVPKIVALFEATYFAGLRKAGMPEE